MKALRTMLLLEVLERAKLAKIVAARWVRTGSPGDRVKASAIAQYVAEQTGEAERQMRLSPAFRRKVQRAVELAGHKQRVHTHGTMWVVRIKERTQ